MNKSIFALASALTLLAPACATHADLPGRHPAYLHALADLRAARWMLEHRPGDAAVSGHEDRAIEQIDAAIGDIKQAAIDDGKDIHDHVGADSPPDFRGRLHRAAELLRKTHADIDHEEDDPLARELKHRALHHIDAAIEQTDKAILDVEGHR